VHAATLPGGVEHPADGGLDVGVGHDQLDAPQAATRKLAQKRRPEGLGLRGTDVEPREPRAGRRC
jgi:hypothetical protein